jgi:RND family efflux transporter MFP subunit
MRNILLVILAATVWTSCQPKGDEVPTDVPGMKALIKEKKAEITTIETEIEDLREQIAELEPRREKPPVLVQVTEVEAEDFKRFTDVQAAVMSSDVVFASSEMGGRLTSMTVREGQYVKRGQMIAAVDVQTLNDQKAELQTSMQLAKDVYDRQQRLWDQQLGTEIQYLQAKNNYERLEKSMAVLNTQLSKANVYAPISGVVDQEFLQAGEMSAPGAPIVQIFDPNRLKIVADVPESYLGKIKRGQKVTVSFPALGIEQEKTVSLVGRSIDPSNRTFKVEVNTGSMGGKLKPNLLADLAFVDYQASDAILADLPLVQEEVSGKKYVYVTQEKAGKTVAEKAYIEIGEGNSGRVIIETGLKVGDKLITDGARAVSPGATVKIISK